MNAPPLYSKFPQVHYVSECNSRSMISVVIIMSVVLIPQIQTKCTKKEEITGFATTANATGPSEACKNWWKCRRNWRSWGQNLHNSYGKTVDLNVGEYFCVRAFECEKARSRFCKQHANDGHPTVCLMCQIWSLVD